MPKLYLSLVPRLLRSSSVVQEGPNLVSSWIKMKKTSSGVWRRSTGLLWVLPMLVIQQIIEQIKNLWMAMKMEGNYVGKRELEDEKITQTDMLLQCSPLKRMGMSDASNSLFLFISIFSGSGERNGQVWNPRRKDRSRLEHFGLHGFDRLFSVYPNEACNQRSVFTRRNLSHRLVLS